MTTKKKVVQSQEAEPTEEEVNEAQARIEALEKKSHQLESLLAAAAQGDHKLVLSKLGVKVAPTAPQPAPQPQSAPQPQPAPQALAATPQGVQSQLDDSQWSQVNQAFAAQNKQIQDLTGALQSAVQEVGILKAEQQSFQLKNAMSVEIKRLIEGGDLPFVEHMDQNKVLSEVMNGLSSFKKTFGYETTIGQVLSEMNAQMKGVFDKYADKMEEQYGSEDDEASNEGEEKEGQVAAEESDEQEKEVPDEERDYEFQEGTPQERGKPGEGTVKLLDPGDEEAKDKLVDDLLEKHLQAKQQGQAQQVEH